MSGTTSARPADVVASYKGTLIAVGWAQTGEDPPRHDLPQANLLREPPGGACAVRAGRCGYVLRTDWKVATFQGRRPHTSNFPRSS